MVAQHAAAAFCSLDACLAGLSLVQRHWDSYLNGEEALAYCKDMRWFESSKMPLMKARPGQPSWMSTIFVEAPATMPAT